MPESRLTEEQRKIRDSTIWWISTYSQSSMILAGDHLVSECVTPNILKGLERTINEFITLKKEKESFIIMYNKSQKSIMKFSEEIVSSDIFTDLEKDEYTSILRQIRQHIRDTVIRKTGEQLPLLEPEVRSW